MEPVSLAFAVVTAPAALIHSGRKVKDHFSYFRHDREKWGNIIDQVSIHMKSLETCKSEQADAQNIRKDLQALLETAFSERNRRNRRRHRAFLKATADHAKLEKATKDLRDLDKRVRLVCNRRGCSSFYNGNSEPPLCIVGLDLSAGALEFLKHSLTSAQTHRVISICGQPGIGKSTLLNKIWDDASSRPPFGARACVSLGMASKITKIQSQIVSRLTNEKVRFPSTEFGRESLKNLFLSLKNDKKPLFLAIDDVWEAADLEKLLPLKMTSAIMPELSCIVVACADHRAVEALLRIYHLSEDNKLQVCHLKMECLSFEASKLVVAENSNIQHSDPQHKDMLNATVALCGGVPLALRELGKILHNPENRRPEAWRRIEKQWATFSDKDDQGTLQVIKSLELSYNYLTTSRKAALLDVIHNFNGWRWDVVESVLEREVMADLRKTFHVHRVDGVNQCNQNALRDGWCDSQYPLSGMETPGSGFVSIPDLTLRFGESIIGGGYMECDLKELQNVLRSATQIRNLILKVRRDDGQFAQELLPYLEGKVAELQTLIVVDSGDRSPTIKYRSVAGFATQDQQLRVLHLYGSGLGTLLEKAAPEIRDLRLTSCNDIVSQLDISLPKLRRLEISGCQTLQKFSVSCVKSWESLEHFVLKSCSNVTCIPTELGDLPSLKTVTISDCASLQQFPSLTKPKGLFSLEISRCPSLETVGSVNCSLEKLVIHMDSNLFLPAGFLQNSSSLQFLSLKGIHLEMPQQKQDPTCLEYFTPDDNVRRDLASLLSHHEGFPQLKVLELYQFDLKKLEILGSLDRLEVLVLQGWNMPPEDGFKNLRSLQELTLKECGSLKKLPASLCTILSLQLLDLKECGKLTELPGNLGDLRSLTRLCLSGCKSLNKLPHSLCGISSLECLDLSECSSLSKLPQDLGNLCSLRQLNLNGCKRLPKLPKSLCSIRSLKTLSMENCCRLLELPEDLGNLDSLQNLQLSGCKNLKKMPESLCGLGSLQILHVKECDSLCELPENIGNLYSLFELSLKGCKSLEKLPESLRRIECLTYLDLDDCDSLNTTSDELANLTSLQDLNSRGCTNLMELPKSLCRIPSLGKLQIKESVSLDE